MVEAFHELRALSLSGPIGSSKLNSLVVARPRQRRRSSPESVVLSSIEFELTGGQTSWRMECEILSVGVPGPPSFPNLACTTTGRSLFAAGWREGSSKSPRQFEPRPVLYRLYLFHLRESGQDQRAGWDCKDPVGLVSGVLPRSGTN
jgi:hypothetical protein